MQDLLTELLWRNEEIGEAAARICAALPGYRETEQQYDAAARRVRDLIGPELYDQYFVRLMRYSEYEIRAYYSLGLGLREEIARELFTPRNSSPSPAWS